MFKGRFNSRIFVPVKGYVHEAGFERLYGSIENAKNYVESVWNPDVTIWNYDGEARRVARKVDCRGIIPISQCCTDALIAVAKEEELRRNCRCLDEYISRLADLNELLKK